METNAQCPDDSLTRTRQANPAKLPSETHQTSWKTSQLIINRHGNIFLYVVCRTAEYMTSHFARHKARCAQNIWATASEVEEFTTSRLIYTEKHLAIIELNLEFLKNGLHSPSITLCAMAIDHFQSRERKSVWVFRHLLWWWIWPVFNPLHNRFINRAFYTWWRHEFRSNRSSTLGKIVKLTFL